MYMVYANLQATDEGISRSPAYNAMDPSEKSAISYFFGMTFAKLIAEFRFDTPWLVHFAKFQTKNPAMLAGRSRPDLIGRNHSGEWIVVEAKGRTNSYSPSLMHTAKEQARQVLSIGGSHPTLRLATQVYFAKSLELEIWDPDQQEEDGANLQLTPEAFLESYYDPFARLPVNRVRVERIADEPFRLIVFEEMDVAVGCRQDILETGVPREFLAGAEKSPSRAIVNEATTVYPDGIAVRIGPRWSEESMRQPPQQR
jgi:hypothetical protein